MFRSATTRIAHNSHVPGLAQAAISKDLKALQDLINAEKTVQQTLQRLGGDFTKASEAAKVWGNGEGDDLGDTLTACTALLLHFANALAQFSTHIGTVREQMKQVRTREENLDELKKRRKSLVSKAESADKKLSKMSGEHKNFQAQADSLNKLREEIRQMDTEILNEESSLADFKRTNAKNWMGIKFGALAECCEKGLIVSEMGKLVIAEIPQLKSEPGLPRPYYTAHANTEALVSEGRRRIESVGFSTEPSIGVRQLPGPEIPPMPGTISRSSSLQFAYGAQSSAPGTPDPTTRNSNGNRFSQVILSPTGTSYIGLPEVGAGTPGLGMTALLESNGSPYQLPRSPAPGSISTSADPYDPYAAVAQQPPYSPRPDEFGVQPTNPFTPRTSSLRNLNDSVPPPSPMGPRGGRFATFPVKAASAAPPTQPEASGSSLPVSPRLDDRPPSVDVERPDESFASSVAEALGEQWVGDRRSTSSGGPTTGKGYEAKMYAMNRDYSPPPPQYTPIPEPALGTIVEQPTGTEGHGDQRGAQAVQDNQSHQGGNTGNPFRDNRQSSAEGEEESALAYMSPSNENNASLPSSSGNAHEDRRVRFDSSPVESEPVNITAPEQVASEIRTQSPPAGLDDVQVPTPGVSEAGSQSQVPTSPEDEEKALNAAAAREVSRELDALMFSSPLKNPDPPKPVQRPDPLEVPDRPFVRRYAPRRSSIGGESLSSLTSPTSPRNEPSYVRERDRSAVTSSPTTSLAPASPTASSSHGHSAEGIDTPLQPPPPIALPPPSHSPAPSSTSSTPFRTPLSEFPAPLKGPGSFYNLPGASGSGGFAPGGPRTISAAAFKRQIRSPSSPPPPDSAGALPGGTSPLTVNKRMPASRLQPGEPVQRTSSAPGPNAPPRAGYVDEPRNRSSAAVGDHQEEDSYDYISAYMDDHDDPASARSGQGQGQGQGYGSGRFATNLESGGGNR